jgi:hypothetical protein
MRKNFGKNMTGFIYLLLGLFMASCQSIGKPLSENDLVGIWWSETTYYKNYVIINFKDNGTGILYMLDNRVTFRNATEKNETIARTKFQYIVSGNNIHFELENKRAFTNKCKLTSAGTILYFDTFLGNTEGLDYRKGFTFKKLMPNEEQSFLQIELEKWGDR